MRGSRVWRANVWSELKVQCFPRVFKCFLLCSALEAAGGASTRRSSSSDVYHRVANLGKFINENRESIQVCYVSPSNHDWFERRYPGQTPPLLLVNQKRTVWSIPIKFHFHRGDESLSTRAEWKRYIVCARASATPLTHREPSHALISRRDTYIPLGTATSSNALEFPPINSRLYSRGEDIAGP